MGGGRPAKKKVLSFVFVFYPMPAKDGGPPLRGVVAGAERAARRPPVKINESWLFPEKETARGHSAADLILYPLFYFQGGAAKAATVGKRGAAAGRGGAGQKSDERGGPAGTRGRGPC